MSNLCPQCQYENRENARFCAECGAALAIEPQTTSPDQLAAEFAGAAADLGAGTLVAGRYYLLAAAAPDRLVYAAEDHGVCRACGMEALATDDELYCSNCGAELLHSSSPWPACWLEEITAVNGDPHVTWQGHTFVVVTEDVADSIAATESTSDAGAAAERLEDAPEDCRPSLSVFLLVGQRSDAGDTRRGQANQDSLFVLTAAAGSSPVPGPTLGLYLVADGMGGHTDGEIASRSACEVIAADLLGALNLPTLGGYAPDTTLELIEGALQNANHQIYAAASADGSNMGTTAVLAVVVDDQAYFANVGDSRASLWRAGELHQVTEDHSHVFTLFKNGLIEEDAIYTHPRRNEIFRSLGGAPVVDVDCCQAALIPGDLLLLCSDGLWEMLRREGIADVLELNLGDPQVTCDELVRRANLAGGDDNISVVAVRVVARPPV
jgi:serine/threonine protein phosphatase PrpC